MTAAQLIKHRRAVICHKDMDMWIRRRDVEMAERCGEMEFSLYGRDGGALAERVSNFNYLGSPLDKTYDD